MLGDAMERGHPCPHQRLPASIHSTSLFYSFVSPKERNTLSHRFIQKVVAGWNKPSVAGSADALVRSERGARIWSPTEFL